MTENQFLIHDLAKRAGITVRTIRYYTDEGLLPQPMIQGKYAFYTETHLKRLELIRRMKETYLPLREIREIINSFNDEEVERRISEPTLFASTTEIADPSPARSGAKALQYISRLTEEQASYRSEEAVDAPRSSPSEKKEQREPIHAGPFDNSSLSTRSEKWQRISIAPGIELHLREPVDPDTAPLIHELVNFAQKLFNTQKR